MTSRQSDAPTLIGLLWEQIQEKATYGGTLAAGVLAVGGFFVDDLSLEMKIALIAVVCGLAVVGVVGIRWRAQREDSAAARAETAEAELSQLRSQIDVSAPEAVLDTVGTALFVRPGGWRLTLFVLEPVGDEMWCLRPLITRASSEVFESSPHGPISLADGPLREVLSVDANDPLHPFSNESANLPNRDIEPEQWSHMHSQIIPGKPGTRVMATRKFSWTVIKEPTSRRTLVLLGESVLADGIRLDVIRSQLLSPTIALISRMSGVSALPAQV
jgi:hypothetical protein